MRGTAGERERERERRERKRHTERYRGEQGNKHIEKRGRKGGGGGGVV